MVTPLNEILEHYPEVKGVHPACHAVPPMSDVELDELIADIRSNGLTDAIMLTPEGLLLDGRHRLIACYESNSEPRFRQVPDEAWTYTCSKNLKRRHLNAGQKAVFLEAMAEEQRAQAKERQREHGETAPGKPANQLTLETTLHQLTSPKVTRAPQTREIVAKQMAVGQRAVDKVSKIREYMPELIEEIKDGALLLEPAYREARKVEKRQKALAADESPSAVNMNKVAYIIPYKGEAKEIPEPRNVRFNRTNESIGWAN